mmetsp:Transcript_127182/g.254138  ORF Transcript_127182/g.254138 Transcript_127182/m.254138 type:complete len:207 (-) Transcript_127182:88-708(-)
MDCRMFSGTRTSGGLGLSSRQESMRLGLTRILADVVVRVASDDLDIISSWVLTLAGGVRRFKPEVTALASHAVTPPPASVRQERVSSSKSRKTVTCVERCLMSRPWASTNAARFLECCIESPDLIDVSVLDMPSLLCGPFFKDSPRSAGQSKSKAYACSQTGSTDGAAVDVLNVSAWNSPATLGGFGQHRNTAYTSRSPCFFQSLL